MRASGAAQHTTRVVVEADCGIGRGDGGDRWQSRGGETRIDD